MKLKKILAVPAAVALFVLGVAGAEAHGVTCQTSDIHYRQVKGLSQVRVDDLPGAQCQILYEDPRNGRGRGLRFVAYYRNNLYSQRVWLLRERCVDSGGVRSCYGTFRVDPYTVN